MLSLAQHADYAQHLSVYAVSCTVMCIKIIYISVQSKSVGNVQNYEVLEGVYWTT
jgi:hypothetical protein